MDGNCSACGYGLALSWRDVPGWRKGEVLCRICRGEYDPMAHYRGMSLNDFIELKRHPEREIVPFPGEGKLLA